jgi:hypothetical protein
MKLSLARRLASLANRLKSVDFNPRSESTKAQLDTSCDGRRFRNDFGRVIDAIHRLVLAGRVPGELLIRDTSQAIPGFVKMSRCVILSSFSFISSLL